MRLVTNRTEVSVTSPGLPGGYMTTCLLRIFFYILIFSECVKSEQITNTIFYSNTARILFIPAPTFSTFCIFSLPLISFVFDT